MPSQDKFRDLYHDQMEPLLRKHEGFRNTVVAALTLGLILILIVLTKGGAFGSLTMVLLIGTAVLSGTFGLYHYQDYKRDYKKRVNAKMIKLINPDYKYFYERHFDLNTVLTSGIYNEKPDSVTGDDFVAGSIGDTPFEFCELNTHLATSKSPLFKGLFFRIGLDRQLPMVVSVFAEHGAGLSNDLTRKFQKRLGNSIAFFKKFDSVFSVYCKDPTIAKRLIGPHLQKALLELQSAIYRPIHITFHHNHIYFAVPFGKKLFEPKLLQKGPQPGDIMESFELFTMVDTIVHHLKLTDQQIEEDAVSFVDVVPESPEELRENAQLAPEPVVPKQTPVEIKASEPIAPAIDQSLHLEALQQSILGFKETTPERDLQTYLQALYKNLLAQQEDILTQEVIVQLLSDSFTSEPQPMEDSWLEITTSPGINKRNIQVKESASMTFTQEVLKFQIAELEKMKGNQRGNAMRQYGVASETGTPWYNFDPCDNLTSGINQLLKQSEVSKKTDWSLIGVLLQLGRVNG